MAKKNLVTLAEIHEATIFLRAIGAPTSNANMIYAVVAWLRYAKPQNSLGGGNDINYLANGRKVVKVAGGTELVLTFKNNDTAITALAKRLLSSGSDWRQFNLIVSSARSGSQFDFLDALAYSWARGTGMYGWNEKDITTNALYREYVSFTGMQQVIPATKASAKIPLPVIPLAAPATPLNYLDPYRIAGFYRARHKGTGVDRTS